MQLNTQEDEHSPTHVYQFQDKSIDLDTEALFELEEPLQHQAIHINLQQTDKIFDLFQIIDQIANQNQIPFESVYKTNEQMVLMNIQHSSLIDRIKKMYYKFSAEDSRYCIILVKVEMRQSITLKALSGDWKINETLLKKISNAVYQQGSGKIDKIVSQHFDDLQQYSLIYISDQESDQRLNPFYHNSLAVTMIYRFCQEKDIEIKEQIRKIMKGQTKPMKQIYKYIEQLMDEVRTNNQLMKTQMIQQFYVFGIEKYIFQLSYEWLMKSYIDKYSIKQSDVNQKKTKIKEQLSLEQIISVLEIKQQFMLNPQNPFMDCILELQKITIFITPSEKLRCLQQMMVMIRCQAFEKNQKEEIISMDDELPIIVFITLMCGIKDLYAEIQFIEDYIVNDQNIENEKKGLTNLKVSLDYIANEWKL